MMGYMTLQTPLFKYYDFNNAKKLNHKRKQ
jgi:hypothetical protein